MPPKYCTISVQNLWTELTLDASFLSKRIFIREMSVHCYSGEAGWRFLCLWLPWKLNWKFNQRNVNQPKKLINKKRDRQTDKRKEKIHTNLFHFVNVFIGTALKIQYPLASVFILQTISRNAIFCKRKKMQPFSWGLSGEKNSWCVPHRWIAGPGQGSEPELGLTLLPGCPHRGVGVSVS